MVAVAVVLDALNRYEPIGIDFHTYLAAALVGIRDGWPSIYDQSLVAAAQRELNPGQVAQPFLSPPTDAWLTAPLTLVPYWVAYWTWAAVTFAAFAGSLVWASKSRGIGRWVIAAAAIAPWWVLHAVNLGQVAPLVATGVVLAARLLRERRDVAAGIALALLFLKPNTAFLVPVVVLVSGRYRAFVAWAACGAAVAAAAIVTLGPGGVSAYLHQLTGTLPEGANNLTVEGAFGLSGAVALVARLVISAVSVAAAFRLRSEPAMVLAAGSLGSLLAVTYLHGSDLCLFSAAAWIVWEERASLTWRIPIAAAWLVSVPYVNSTSFAIRLNRWPILELALLVALAVTPWLPAWSAPRARASASGS